MAKWHLEFSDKLPIGCQPKSIIKRNGKDMKFKIHHLDIKLNIEDSIVAVNNKIKWVVHPQKMEENL